jgi:hypothetical protein
MSQASKPSTLPPLVHIRNPGAGTRPSVPPSSSGAVSEDYSGRAVPVDVVRRDLLAGTLSRDTEVLFTGLGDWTPAHEIPELWIAPALLPPPGRDNDAPADSTDAPRSSSVGAGEPVRKKSFGAGAVVGAIGAAVALLALGAAAVYFAYFHYRPVAVQHLPKKCYVAVRVDLVDWAWFKPLSDRIVPALEEASKPKPPVVAAAPGPSFKERLKANAGIDLDRDVREFAMCWYEDNEARAPGAARDPWYGKRPIVVLGGRMRPGSIPGIFEALRSEGIAVGFRLDGTGELAVIRTPPIGPLLPSFIIGQAEDGSVIIAPSDSSLAAAREQRPEEEARVATGLLGKGALEVVVEHFLWGLTAKTVAPSGPIDTEMMEALGKVQTGHVGLSLGSAPRFELSLEGKSEADAKLVEGALRKLLEAGQKAVAGSAKDWAGEHAALSGARINRDDTKIDLRIDFRLADVDRGAGELAQMIKDDTSPLRAKAIPLAAFLLGVGPKPRPAVSSSASGAPSGVPSIKPPPEPEDD